MKAKIVCIYLCMLLMIPVFSLALTANSPPTAPDIEGPTSGKAEIPQTYTFTSTDPDGDDISYYIRWGCGCGDIKITDFYPSGEPVTLSHTYAKGTYVMRVTALDINQAESDLSTLEITMPRNRPMLNMFSIRFLQNHPLIYQLLQILFKF